VPISDLFGGDGKNFVFGEAQEAAFLKITFLFTSGATPIMRHFDQDRPAMIEIDASDFAIGAIVSQKFEDGKIHRLFLGNYRTQNSITTFTIRKC